MKTKIKLLPLVTPGEMLVEEFLKPLGLTEYRLAKDIGVRPRRINEIVHGKRAVTTDTAFRLSQYSATAHSSGSTSRPITNCDAWNAKASCLRSRAARCSPRPEPLIPRVRVTAPGYVT